MPNQGFFFFMRIHLEKNNLDPLEHWKIFFQNLLIAVFVCKLEFWTLKVKIYQPCTPICLWRGIYIYIVKILDKKIDRLLVYSINFVSPPRIKNQLASVLLVFGKLKLLHFNRPDEKSEPLVFAGMRVRSVSKQKKKKR